MFYEIIMNLRYRLSQTICQKGETFLLKICGSDINYVTFRKYIQKRTKQRIYRRRFLSDPTQTVPKPPKKMAPKPPSPSSPSSPSFKDQTLIIFNDPLNWNKTLTIISEEYEKIRVKIEWKFTINNKIHFAILTHSQKRNTSLPSSRALYVDGIKMYYSRSTDRIFTTMIEGNVLKWKIEGTHSKYKYLMLINKISHSFAYTKWITQKNNLQLA
eukprot:221933_1